MGSQSSSKVVGTWVYKHWFIYQLEDNMFYIMNPTNSTFNQYVKSFAQCKIEIDNWED